MIRLFLLTALTMVAFAANSVLTRIGIDLGGMEPLVFALLRVASGAVALLALVRLRGKRLSFARRTRIVGGLSLATYMLGFSLAYVSLDAGIGALIVFGVVQITMFTGALLGGEVVPVRRWIGAALAFSGLVYLFLPGAAAPPLLGSAMMIAAGIGWGIYSLTGRTERDALAGTAANFLLCLPLTIVVALLFRGEGVVSALGVSMAVTSGALTSALGYALWYTVLPALGATRAAVAQLSAPVIAIAGGAALLNEVVTGRMVLATAIVLGGIALSVTRPKT